MDTKTAKKYLNSHLKTNHNITIDDVEITESSGYWRSKKPCTETCHAPIHSFMGCSDRTCHTYLFTERGARDEAGRFVSPYRVWNTLKGAAE